MDDHFQRSRKKPSMQAGEKLGATGDLHNVGRGTRVVVADDERDTLLTIGILLRSEGFEVATVQKPAEVAAAVKELHPHAVILDIGMPGPNGYDVARQLRAELGRACPTLVAVTAHASEADKARAQESGFHYHIAKPYDPAQLLALLAKMGPQPTDPTVALTE